MNTITQEKLISYYDETMVRMDRLRTVEKTSEGKYFPEIDIGYGLAIANLIRNGVPFTLTHSQPKVEEKKSPPFIGIVQEEQPKETAEEDPDVLTIKDSNGGKHIIPCSVMESLLKKEYRTLILKETDASRNSGNVTMNISVPDYSDSIEDQVKEEEKTLQNLIQKQEGIESSYTEERLPVFAENDKFRKDARLEKSSVTFLYNKHEVLIDFGSQGVGKITFFVYPLEIKQDSNITDIMVVAESGGLVRAAISRGTSSAVKIEYDQFPFIVRGRWEHGAFLSQVNSLDENIAKSMTDSVESFVPEERTSTTFFKTEYDGVFLYAFPARYGENENTGYALTALAVEDHGSITVLTPRPTGEYVVTCSNGEELSVDLYWIGSSPISLRCKIDREDI